MLGHPAVGALLFWGFLLFYYFDYFRYQTTTCLRRLMMSFYLRKKRGRHFELMVFDSGKGTAGNEMLRHVWIIMKRILIQLNGEIYEI